MPSCRRRDWRRSIASWRSPIWCSASPLRWISRLGNAASSVDGAEASESEAEDDGAGSFSRPDLESAYEAPETDSEKLLARVWSELLGIRQIGVNDDFFQLGGHSLHAVRLFVAIRKNYGISLPLSTLFERPSIRPLAALLDAQSPRSKPPPAREGKTGAPR